MFNNLIESSSHRGELKRRGSFFLFTVATYALLFVITGVVSIYAYDTRLGEQNLQVVTMLSPMDLPSPVRTIADSRSDRGHVAAADQPVDTRRHPTAAVDVPTLTPEKISVEPNPELPVRGPYRIGKDDVNATIATPVAGSGENGSRATATQVIEVTTPPPDPAPKIAPKILRSPGVLNGQALSLPRPAYPQMAKMMHLEGRVNVQVLIDETGKVISARAVDGHPLFRAVSEAAAQQARFSATKLGEQAVKVSGIITYNFVLQ